jgi:hypothetical protein
MRKVVRIGFRWDIHFMVSVYETFEVFTNKCTSSYDLIISLSSKLNEKSGVFGVRFLPVQMARNQYSWSILVVV